MKRFLCLLLLLPLLLCGCADGLKDPVTFYYIRTSYAADMSSVIGSEQKEASGHRDDLSYLMALYLMGPADEELQSPLPTGIHILSVEQSASHVILTLSDISDSMTDSQFTLAGSCLTLTCLELTDAESVTVRSEDRSVTLTAETLLLQDLFTTSRMEEPK